MDRSIFIHELPETDQKREENKKYPGSFLFFRVIGVNLSIKIWMTFGIRTILRGWYLRTRPMRLLGRRWRFITGWGLGFSNRYIRRFWRYELARRSIPFQQQRRFRIEYKGTIIEKEYIADYVCFDQIIVELKALNQLSPVDWSQVLNYLKVSKMRVGLLFNFGSVGRLEWKKLVI